MTASTYSRRQFLHSVGKAGGAAAVMATMQGLDLTSAFADTKAPFSPPTPGDFTLLGRGNDTSVLILGAGIAGLTTAYELQKAGYTCTILEARERPGGRAWTARRGSRLVETDGTSQVADFSEGLYMNMGPARIPQHHTTMEYCRELGVPIEAFANQNADAYYFNDAVGALSATPVRHRTAKADIYGYVAELLAKATDQGALDADLSEADQERLVEFLRSWGALGPDDTYTGTGRRGYVDEPAIGPGEVAPPYALTDLLQSRFGFSFPFEFGWDQAMMMFQPVGGMDRIPYALEGALQRKPQYRAVVASITNGEDGVTVRYQHRGAVRQITADYCICTVPPQIAKQIPNNFDPAVQAALAEPVPAATGKLGLEYGRRWWEQDDGIYGGITNTNLDLSTIWYPSHDLLAERGIVIGYYNFGANAQYYGDLTPRQRTERGIEQGVRIHGEKYRSELTGGDFSVPWQKVPYSEGGWISWPNGRGAAYDLLLQPAGRTYFAGDHLSYVTSWQHGAFESARHAVMSLHQRVLAAA